MVIGALIVAVLWYGVSMVLGLVVGVTIGDEGAGVFTVVNAVAVAIIQAMQLVVLAAVALEFDEHSDEAVS
ncbi:MAG: hypothetical protein H7287_00930, partial [Thermoleophilia bacterium]|nr:hypothetical protein [Thermoleophilia bacterium]